MVVRVRCDLCDRVGSYRLAAKYGPEIPLDHLLDSLALDCRWRPGPGERHPGKYDAKCGAYFQDPGSPRPPDLLPGLMKSRVVSGDKG